VKVVQHVLVEQVGLVEEEDRVNTLAAKIFDVGGDGEKESRSGGGRREPQGEAKLAVEIAAAEGGVVAVGEAETGLRQPVAQGTQDAGFASTRIAGEDDGSALVEGLAQLVYQSLLGRRHPQIDV
jgi:hypothetical protein